MRHFVDLPHAQHPLAAHGGRCNREPPRLKRNVGRLEAGVGTWRRNESSNTKETTEWRITTTTGL